MLGKIASNAGNLSMNRFLVCGIYVDLNRIRAGEALTPESSNRTSAYDRIGARQQRELEVHRREVENEPGGQVNGRQLTGWLAGGPSGVRSSSEFEPARRNQKKWG
jgi:hypothetical protein